MRCVSSQVEPGSLPGAMILRTRGANTSAPPPGSVSSPAAISSCSTSSCVRPDSFVMWWISDAVNSFRCTSGIATRSARGEVGVVREVEVRVLAADHVDLGELLVRADLQRLLDQVVDRPHLGVGLLRRARERAELALHPADRRVVQVQVVDEEDVVRAAAEAARGVGQLAEREQVVALEQRDAVVEVEALTRDDLVADLHELLVAACGDGQLHASRSTTPRTTARSGRVSRCSSSSSSAASARRA